mgnify:CR=1 FL=1
MIYSGMDKEERNRIIEERCAEMGIRPRYDAEGRAGYVPSLEDKMLYLDNCENPELREELGNALTEIIEIIETFPAIIEKVSKSQSLIAIFKR